MAGPIEIATPDPAAVAAVHASAPLAADLVLRCGPFDVPVGMAAVTPTLEQEDSEPARALAWFLANNPWESMYPLSPGGWVLLARDDDRMAFGQRAGAIGLPHVTTLVRTGGRLRAKGLGGPLVLSSTEGEQVHSVHQAAVRRRTLTLAWDASEDESRVQSSLLRRVDVLETDDEVHVLVVSEPNPDQVLNVDPESGAIVLSGQAKIVTATVELRAPLGRRGLLDDVVVPARPVPVERPL